MQFAAFRRHEKIQLLAAGVAISALVAGASVSQAAECGDLAGKVFGPATITGATTVSPPSSSSRQRSSNSGGDQGYVLPRAGRDQTDRRFRHQIRGLASAGKRVERSVWRNRQRRLRRLSDSSCDGVESRGGLRGLGHRHRSSGRPARRGLGAGHPEKVADFGWRAIHETADASKSVIGAYYGKTASKSYFAGCSDGVARR